MAKHQRLGAKIRTLRRRKGLSQRKLAERLGISARAMSHYVQRFGLDDLR